MSSETLHFHLSAYLSLMTNMKKLLFSFLNHKIKLNHHQIHQLYYSHAAQTSFKITKPEYTHCFTSLKNIENKWIKYFGKIDTYIHICEFEPRESRQILKLASEIESNIWLRGYEKQAGRCYQSPLQAFCLVKWDKENGR